MSSKIFNNLARGAGVASAGVIFALAASPASAATCATVGTTGSIAGKVAVASNFFAPMIELMQLYTAANSNKITVCHASTGVLKTEITNPSDPSNPNPNHYSLFLAADETADSLAGSGFEQTGATSTLFAHGIPVLVSLYSTVNDVHTLIPNLSTANHASLSGVLTSTNALSIANSQNIAVADPGTAMAVNAPYGVAAYLIMNDMGLWSTMSSPPSGVHTPLYSNITLTFDSVTDGTNKSGFVSKSQICEGIAPIHASPPVYTYIEFTNAKYVRVQKGIAIKSGDGTDSTGAGIFNYMLSDPNWNDFLEDHCYAPI